MWIRTRDLANGAGAAAGSKGPRHARAAAGEVEGAALPGAAERQGVLCRG